MQGDGCTTFDGEGTSDRGLIDYPWIFGRTYTSTFSPTSNASVGTYVDTVVAERTHAASTIGALLHAASSKVPS